ncbi:ABC transporter ATP-binding protein [Nocardioides sp. SYSU D00038]|uniref:ABC transporter ATP-binding protein n=1 Tax=Nocardioides sp. SYSU D00038 TaxID=2812554 RepID=UPI001967F983|nr:ABC transporter ATP-binding protein [Nocardioides sp. SYSU D00038]
MTDTATPAIRVSGLRRSYGAGAEAFEAVRGVDLTVETGTVTALLGTNGAGKTSTLEVIEGLARPDAGSVRVLGLDPVADRDGVRRRTGVLLQHSGFSGDLTVLETVRLWTGLVSGARPAEDALDLLDLAGRAGVRVSSLSGGERRRLDLACTLLGTPEVVLLDEPTTGLDPESRRDVWRLVRGLRDRGATVLLTTHYLDEAEALADRLEILHEGRIVRSGTTAEIVAGHPSTVSFRTPAGSLPAFGPRLDVVRVVEERGRTTIETEELQPLLTQLLGWADRHGVRLDGLSASTPSLESVFLAIADDRTEALR